MSIDTFALTSQGDEDETYREGRVHQKVSVSFIEVHRLHQLRTKYDLNLVMAPTTDV